MASNNADPFKGDQRFESLFLQRRVGNELFRRWASMEPSRDSRYPRAVSVMARSHGSSGDRRFESRSLQRGVR